MKDASMKHKESAETPEIEAKYHGRKFLSKALKLKGGKSSTSKRMSK